MRTKETCQRQPEDLESVATKSFWMGCADTWCWPVRRMQSERIGVCLRNNCFLFRHHVMRQTGTSMFLSSLFLFSHNQLDLFPSSQSTDSQVIPTQEFCYGGGKSITSPNILVQQQAVNGASRRLPLLKDHYFSLESP
jgi:hypothetical protein